MKALLSIERNTGYGVDRLQMDNAQPDFVGGSSESKETSVHIHTQSGLCVHDSVNDFLQIHLFVILSHLKVVTM